jgi:hypothetical protein
VKAPQGQDALIITSNGLAPLDQQTKLVHAAAEAGVPWIFPNEWSPDTANEDLVRDVMPFQRHATISLSSGIVLTLLLQLVSGMNGVF